MGYWGTGLYSNDCTCDVRDSYLDYLKKGVSNDEAYQKTLDSYAECMGTDDEPLFWYALADTQWKHGRLRPCVKQKALDWLKYEGGLSLWTKKEHVRQWKKVMEDLEQRLNTPQGPEKKIRDTTVIQYNPGCVGDVFAYRFHTKAAEESGYSGKYILMQKTGEVPGVFWGDQMIPQMIVYDMLFDEIPCEIHLSSLRVLPFSAAKTYMPTGRNWLRPKLNLQVPYALHRKSHTPQKYMTFVGSYDVPLDIQKYSEERPSGFAWDRIEETLISFRTQWKGYTYRLFPTESLVTKIEQDGVVHQDETS